jgi:hypothetical protein
MRQEASFEKLISGVWGRERKVRCSHGQIKKNSFRFLAKFDSFNSGGHISSSIAGDILYYLYI